MSDATGGGGHVTFVKQLSVVVESIQKRRDYCIILVAPFKGVNLE